MNFEWTPVNKLSKRIEQLHFQRNIQHNCQKLSPTINFLKHTQKVKNTKRFYEANLSINESESHYQTPPMDLYTSAEQGDGIIRNYQINLVQSEACHLRNLEVIAGEFEIVTAESAGFVPMMIRKLNISLSGCLNEIIELHKHKILPKFQASDISSAHILSYLLHLITSSQFYCYVTHAMLYNSTIQWLEHYQLILNNIFIKSGVNFSRLDLHDIIRLYRDYCADVYVQLLLKPRENADEIELCKIVKHKLDHLLNMIAEAEKISYIKEVSQNDMEAIEKLHKVMETTGKEIEFPSLILFPRHDPFYGYRSPIDILKLGQFVRIWNEPMMLSQTSNCYYDTNLFIFERCIIYTIIVNDRKLLYNGHFWIKDCTFESIIKNGSSVILAVLNCNDRQLVLDKKDFVGAVMRLHQQHKYEEIDAEIDVPFESHLKILAKIEDPKNYRRLPLAVNN